MCTGNSDVYGFGVCAEFGGAALKPLVGEALSKLNVVNRHPNALSTNNVMAYDNAVSAVEKICWYHRDSTDSAQGIKKICCGLLDLKDAVENLGGNMHAKYRALLG